MSTPRYQTEFAKRCETAARIAMGGVKNLQTAVAQTLSQRLGKTIKPQTIQYMFTRASESQLTADLAALCGVSYAWLARGEGAMTSSEGDQSSVPSPLPTHPESLWPVLQWSEISDYVERQRLPARDLKRITCPYPLGPRSYVVPVQGVEMQPRFAESEGERIVQIWIDPDLPAKPGDCIVVQRPGARGSRRVFRRWRAECRSRNFIVNQLVERVHKALC